MLVEPGLDVDARRVGALVEDAEGRAVEEEPRHPKTLLLSQRQDLAPLCGGGSPASLALDEV